MAGGSGNGRPDTDLICLYAVSPGLWLPLPDRARDLIFRGAVKNTSILSLSAVQIAKAVQQRDLSAQSVIAQTFDLIQEYDYQTQAWVCRDEQAALAKARLIDAGHVSGLLPGVPIGVKDIIDTADYPTSYGSSIYQHYQPAHDAACVALAKEAGAIVVGKTVTTEFACFEPGPTRNPHNLAHTPGGSSSGSAAAVASGMIALAFGTQTAGSLIRPASYCGIWTLKPSYGLFSLAGVKGTAQSLDTLGIFARHVEDLALMRAVLLKEPARAFASRPDYSPTIAICRTPDWDRVEPASARALSQAAGSLERIGAKVIDIDLPPEFMNLTQAQRTIQAFETARTLSVERIHHSHQLSPSLLALIEQGLACTTEAYLEALNLAVQCRQKLKDLFRSYDAILAPSAPGTAPAGLTTTGDPVFSRMWTLLHVPSLNIPMEFAENGLPVGVQLVADLLCDRKLLQLGAWVEDKLDIKLRPTLSA